MKEKETKKRSLGTLKDAPKQEKAEVTEEKTEQEETAASKPEIEKKEPVVPDPAIEKMDRQQAMEYFHLPAWASKEDLDNQFWKLGKTYTAQKDEQKLADIALAYSIASGERDRKEQEKTEEVQAKHYFGKTAKQWKDFWHYEWWKFTVAAAVIIAGWAFIQYYFIAPRTDLRMASIGHFQQDTTILEYFLKETGGLKNPEVRDADVVSANSENEEVDEYQMQKATSMMAVHPDILVYDAPTVPVYVNSGDLYILDDVYEKMKTTWSKEDLDRLEPYYYSKAKFYEEYLDSMPETYQDSMEPLTEADYVEHIYGFIVRDKIDQLALGYKLLWKSTDIERVIIVGVGAGSSDLDKAIEYEMMILSNIDTLRAEYLEEHPYAESDD